MLANKQHLIVGWPRGGLGYIGQLLQRSGYGVGYSFDHTTTYDSIAAKLAEAKPYEISSAIVPFLDHPALKEATVTFLTRDPMRVLNSLYFYGLFHGERRTLQLEMACKHLAGFQKNYKGKPAQAIVEFVVSWLHMAKTKRQDLRFHRVESGNKALISFLTEDPSATIPFCLPYVNASNCLQRIKLQNLPEHSRNKMQNLLQDLRYLYWLWNPRAQQPHYVNSDGYF